METKPYDLQSPVKVATEYGGNKQKIAQAAQMGLVDPTAALLAGMFIDRMRSAQQAEMTPQQTVAEQVFAPPAPPQQGGLGASMPLGAPPQGGPPGAPPQGGPPGAPPPPPPQGGPPMGMADGGLASLPVPDSMFDEPDDGGYAGGGMVAFATAGEVRARWERIIRDPKSTTKEREAAWAELTAAKKVEATKGSNLSDFGVSSDADTTEGFVAPAVAGIGNTLKSVFLGPASSVPGLSAEEATQAINTRNLGTAAFGGKYLNYPEKPTPRTFAGPVVPAADAAAKPANTTTVPPGPPTTATARAPVTARTPAPRGGLAAAAAAATPPTADAAPTAPVAAPPIPRSIEDIMKENEKLAGVAGTEDEAYLAERKKSISPEAQAKDKKQAMWEALAQFGLNLASTKSPSLMQAIGEAGTATLPSLKAAEKERKANLKDTLKEIREDERYSNTEKRQRVANAVAQFNQEKEGLREDTKIANQEAQFDADLKLKIKDIESRERIASNQINATLRAAAMSAGADRSTVGDRAAIAWAEAARTAGDKRPYVQLLNQGYDAVSKRSQTPTNPMFDATLGAGTGGARPAAGKPTVGNW